jgi:hypothetical protein
MGLIKPVKDFLKRLFRVRYRTKLYIVLRLPTSFIAWLCLHTLNNYFSFTAEQKASTSKELTTLIRKVKFTSLYVCLNYLKQLQIILRKHCDHDTPLDDAEYEWAAQQSRKIVEIVLMEALPFIVRILLPLNSDQLPSAERLAKQIKRLLDKSRLDEEERLANRHTKLNELCEEVFGPLNASQIAYIRQLAGTLPDLTHLRLEHHQNMQLQFIELMKRPDRSVVLEPTLKSWIENIDITRSDFFRNEMVQKRAANKHVALAIFEVMNVTQRRHSLLELNGIIDEIANHLKHHSI